MFKKVYIEITNLCNLSCSFCIKHQRKLESISIDNFKVVLNQLEGYTKYLYFHVLGEPLLHPNINELINIASDKFKINITTNGYLIKKIENNSNIRQINISLHSYNESGSITLDEYLNQVLSSTELLRNSNTIINYRLWTKSQHSKEIIHKLEEYYQTKINDSTKLSNKVFFEVEKEFTWPSLNNEYCSSTGTCYGTRTHIGILVDGTVVPCCLDNNGTVNLGNIYKTKLSDIINSNKFQEIKSGFQNNKKVEPLCQHCNFKRNELD